MQHVPLLPNVADLDILKKKKNLKRFMQRYLDVKRDMEVEVRREREHSHRLNVWMNVGITSEFLLELYNYLILLELETIINYLFGLA